MNARFFLAPLFLFSLPLLAYAEFAPAVLEKVPVKRLVGNLEDIVAREPKNVTAWFNLARSYAMAYAKKTDEIDVRKGKEALGPWFGYEPSFVPFSRLVAKAADKEKERIAQMHLARAREAYEQTLKLQPDHLAAKLGLAWCIQQAGDAKAAITAYRDAIEAGWKTDKERKTGPLGGHYITKEGAEYLIPLLDKEKDKAEVAMLQDRIAHLKKLPRPVTPLAIPLQDGLALDDLLAPAARVRFDLDGTGPRHWSWITPRAGWLVFDPAGRGKIDSALQLFGNVTFWMFWDDGYQALASLDDNHDGELAGKELTGLALWVDGNGDGVSDPGEVRPLGEHGIVSISCRPESHPTHPACRLHAPRGARYADGRTRPTFDVILQSR